jgi:hypothetical protein
LDNYSKRNWRRVDLRIDHSIWCLLSLVYIIWSIQYIVQMIFADD